MWLLRLSAPFGGFPSGLIYKDHDVSERVDMCES
jgi:hypothetical protein